MLTKAIILIPKSLNKGTEIQMEVLPLVLCKECKKRYTVHCIQEEAGNINNQDDWFCADGERKEGG